MKLIRNFSGFTLIELMIAVTISMILSGAGMVAYNNYNSREKTNQAASEVVSYINLARSSALTNQITDSFVGGLDYVTVVINNGVISAFPVNISSGTGPSYFTKKISNSSSVIITPINFGSLQFGANTGKLLIKDADPSFNASAPNASDLGVSMTITSSLNNSNKKGILVSPVGSIKLYDL